MSESANLYRVSPRQAKELIIDCLEARLVPFVQSSPGMGKSSIMRAVADELNLAMIDHRLSTSDPTDMNGMPNFDADGMAYWAPFAGVFPITSSKIPNGKDGWLLFFDEANAAPKGMQAACYKVVLDRYIGQFPMHQNVVMAMAGNLSTDRAITHNLSTAMQSRVIHIELEMAFKEWLEDVAIPHGYDSRIIAYLNYKNGAPLMDFRPDHQEKTFACPRTWEFMNKLISGKKVDERKTALYAGTLTSGVAVDFVQFTKVFDSMISIKEILADPKDCPIPTDVATRWAVISHMMEKTTEENFEKLAEYADRFDITFRILFYRSVLIKRPMMRTHSAFTKAMTELSRYLND